jgi:hypothetical protein
VRPQELSLGGAAGAASGDAGIAAAVPLGCFDMRLLKGGRGAFRLVGGAFCTVLWCFEQQFKQHVRLTCQPSRGRALP